jgi:hypothetical protein
MKLVKELLENTEDWKKFVDSLSGAENPPMRRNGPKSYPAIVVVGYEYGMLGRDGLTITSKAFVYPHDFIKV